MVNKSSKEGLRVSAAAAILLLSLVLAGCAGGRSPGSGLPEVYSGAEGINAYFAPESAPSRTVSGSSSDLLLLLSNKGAANVDTSKVTVVVRDSRGYFDFEPTIIKIGEHGEIRLMGRTETGNAGSLESLPVIATAKNFLKDEEAKDSGFLAQVCYAYKTRLTANVCIDTSPTNSQDFRKERKPCIMETPVLLGSQGAPVAVRKIEVMKIAATANDEKVVRPRFSIYISNAGNGNVIDDADPHSYCAPQKGNKYKLGTVKVESASIMGLKLSCDKERTLSNSIKNDFIVCEYTGSEIKEGSGTFATPLSIVLSYGYSSTSSPVPVRIDAARVECGDGECNSYAGETCQNCEDDCWKCDSEDDY